ncbi:membrane protein YfhO [Pseudobutyrivibrio sp. YE44]|uniref:YfhO family protein n=1 Tax=Pseudobutyrivibrio sp. YE44 TaxID=1520802 RepID=UPI00087E3869|nr:YfhO family protein [Pseudobutyrivibrio sp. YE44]SDB39003.1 membrane protein YfhO [Pseudobutyrivibrio sp. YE44]
MGKLFTIENKKEFNEKIFTFLICFGIALLSFIYFIWKGDGFLVITNDFNDQQIPFTISAHKAILNGGISGFSWDVDLGTSTLNAYSFYCLGSPFFWLTMLFPANAFPYIAGWIYMLKYACAGLFAYIYLKRFVKDTRWAMVGAILYAFSGYSSINLIFYHFHDVIALFPLLLIGIEIIHEKKDYRLFIFAVFLNCFLNYFFFIGEVIFCIIYFIFRFVGIVSVQEFLVRTGKCIISGVLGVGMAAVLFIPSIIFITDNPRARTSIYLEKILEWQPRFLLYLFKSMLLPGEAMTSLSSVYLQKFYSSGMYLPMVGFVLVFAYMLKNKDWLFKLLIALICTCFFPFFSEAFYLYNESQMRWWYMLVLMMALASIKVLENLEENKITILGGAIGYGALIAFLYVLLEFVNYSEAEPDLIYSHFKLYTLIMIAGLGLLITYFLCTRFDNPFKVILATVSLFAFGTTFLTLYIYTKHGVPVEQYKANFQSAAQYQLPNNQYRLNDTYNLDSMVNNLAGFNNQCSTDSNSIREFEALFDYYDPVCAINKNEYKGLAELLGGKYYITPDYTVVNGQLIAEYPNDLGSTYMVEVCANPIGYAVDSYITMERLKEINVVDRGLALLIAPVIEENNSTALMRKELAEDTVNVSIPVSDYVEKNASKAVENFVRNNRGFTCRTDYDKDQYVYFAVPNDDGWSAYVDDTQVDIINSGGMMIIKVPEGEHSVAFEYVTPGYKVGLVISIFSWGLFVLYLLFYKKLVLDYSMQKTEGID